ncbi:RNA polymerase recycling motor HelD [Alicyclobacillus fodiniaquatilis]|uniref:RNA polymerase recycling motor HelD n=1 Tax=Alicyclobacillus fodiniaquatilis TaxID=1661150 RepID=A0ABW4JG58_9BACL
MGITEQDWHEEKSRVLDVTNQIQERIEQLTNEVGKIKSDVIDIRKNFWDEVTINIGTTEDIIETHFSIRQQAEILSERERRYRHSAATLKQLTRLVDAPYFGRIDFQEHGEQETEQIYIGITSFRNQDENTFLVYDWRAPIASLYYDHIPGPATFQAPFGEVTGDMSLKRQYVIRNKDIQLMFDSGVTIGDELLMQALSRHSDAQMKSIVATIQREQNRIIRNDQSRMLIVQGAAGSGKTSAALQRVAYLLYKYRKTLQADQMVLFSPNPMFNSYVSTVLPELGEENMQQTTFQEYLEHRLGAEFQVEDPFAQIEYILTAVDTPDYQARINGIQFKASTDFLNMVSTYKEVLEQSGMVFYPVKFENEIIITAEQIKTHFYDFDPSIQLINRIELICEWLLNTLTDFVESQLDTEWVETEIELLDADEYDRAYKKLLRTQKGKDITFDDFEQEKQLLSRMVIQKRLKPLRKWIKQFEFVDVKALYTQLFSDQQLFTRLIGDAALPDDWSIICQQTIARLDEASLAYEDATPFLYLKEIMFGMRTNTAVRHVFIDEAQDYSPFQFAFLKRLFPRAKMTALGDLNQAIYAHMSSLDRLDTMPYLYGPEHSETIRLTRSYRSTREIVEFTRGMIPGGSEIEPFNRHGDKPQVTAVETREALHSGIVAEIEQLSKDGYKSIAIICKTASESADAYAALQKQIQLHLVTKFTPTFDKQTLVIPAYLAKGVEFDAVIIYDGSTNQYHQAHERKLFYTACTRAMHRLQIYTLGEMSPFIRTQPSDTFTYNKLANPS